MHKRSLVLTLFEKSYVKWMIAYILSLRKLEYILAETVVGRLNGESLTPWLSFISNAARLSLKLLLSAGGSISSKNGFVIYFLMKTLTFTNDFPFTTSGLTHFGWKKNCSTNSLSARQIFFLCLILHISKRNSFLDLKTKQNNIG